MLRKIECFIQPTELDKIKDVLFEEGVEGMSLSEVQGFGQQRGYTCLLYTSYKCCSYCRRACRYRRINDSCKNLPLFDIRSLCKDVYKRQVL